MSVIADVRKAIQDLVTPDLEAVKVRLDHVEKDLAELKADMKAGFDKIEGRFALAEEKAEGRHIDMLHEVRQIVNYAVVLERLAHVEQEQKRLREGREQ